MLLLTLETAERKKMTATTDVQIANLQPTIHTTEMRIMLSSYQGRRQSEERLGSKVE